MINKVMAGLLCAVMTMGTVQATPKDTIKGWFGFAEQEKPQTIKVLVREQTDGVMLQVTGAYNIFDPRDGRRVATRFVGKGAFIQPIQQGLRWGEEFPGIYQLAFIPDNPNNTILVDGIQYKGTVFVYAIGGKVNIVNEVEVEDYITSILSNQFDDSLSTEALASVAIVARTDAFYHVKEGVNKFWDLKAEETGYQGYSVTNPGSSVERAIIATRGLVLNKKGDRQPFAATWTEHSAGKTAGYSLMYRQDGKGPQKGVKSIVAERDREATRWTYRINKEALARLIGLQNLQTVDLMRDETSNKVYGVHFQDGSYAENVTFLALQKELGKDKLKSSEFSVDVGEEMVTFTGYGVGAGVGLCLYSAEKLAENGEEADSILSSFFPDTQVAMMPTKQVAKVTKAKKAVRRPIARRGSPASYRRGGRG